MAEVLENTAEGQEIDVAAFIASKNRAEQALREGKEPEPVKPPVKEAPKAEAKAEEPAKVEEHIPDSGNRNLRRQLRRLTMELGEARGQLKAYAELGIAVKANSGSGSGRDNSASVSASDDPEPQRQDFADDAQYYRAVGRWDARQEAAKAVSKVTEATQHERQLAALQQQMADAYKKGTEDMKTIPDWDEVQKKAIEDAENGDAPKFNFEDYPNLHRLIATSDVQAFMIHHLAKEPKDLQKLLDMAKDDAGQTRFFSRLEGNVEKMYSKAQETKDGSGPEKAEKPDQSKGRTHPAEAEAGRNAAERDARKPRPTTEVAARGGSAVPEEPEPGTAAWMAKRNAITGGR